ncbi:MAG: hypothetical protein ACLP00_08890 [Terracidiphilus sp.]
MTLPPAVEVREDFRRSENRSTSALAAWFQVSTVDPSFGSWKNDVFVKLAKLERGPDVAGFGDFRLSESAAGQLRLLLARVSLQSLPFPSVVGISGQGAQLDWRSGDRSVEITAFADGELVIEATERGNPVDLDEREGLEAFLNWLVGAADRQLVYAAAR